MFSFSLFLFGERIPVLKGNFEVNNPVVDNKVASAQLVACVNIVPF